MEPDGVIEVCPGLNPMSFILTIECFGIVFEYLHFLETHHFFLFFLILEQLD